MRHFYFYFSKSLAVVVVAVCLQVGFAEGRGQNQDDRFMRPVNLRNKAMTIQQIIFDFDAGTVRGTDWGRVQFDPVMWGKVSGMKSGYINMFVHSQGRSDTVNWVVQNLFMPAQNVKNCPPSAGNNAELSRGPSSARPGRRPAAVHLAKRSMPMSVFFDLRPDIDGSGPVDSIMVNVVVSKQALPVVEEILDIAGSFRPTRRWKRIVG